MLVAILHFLPDNDDPWAVVPAASDALPSGSYLAVQHPTQDFYAEAKDTDRSYRSSGIAFQYRTKDEFLRFLDGLELVPPGLQPMTEWRADDRARATSGALGGRRLCHDRPQAVSLAKLPFVARNC